MAKDQSKTVKMWQAWRSIWQVFGGATHILNSAGEQMNFPYKYGTIHNNGITDNNGK